MNLHDRISALSEKEAKIALYYLVNLVGATTMCNRCILSSYCYENDKEIKCKDRFLKWAIGEDKE